MSAQVYHCDWRDLLSLVPECDTLLVDAPYSERTHAGHDAGVSTAERMRHFATLNGGQEKDRTYALRKAEKGESHRRPLDYKPFSKTDVDAFVGAWSPRVRGWFVSITDDVLAPRWQRALEDSGRYVFAPLPFVAPGSRVRMTGDGPSAWTCWIVAGTEDNDIAGPGEEGAHIVVARPSNREFASWGTLPGAYVLPPGQGGKLPVVGGKPLWLMQRLVEDYSRPGDLVVDPCCGAGTTLVAALRSGRRAIGGDINAEHAELARKWCSNPTRPAPGIETEDGDVQPGLFKEGA